MKALSIRQPWAWLIVNGYKDIENRNWSTHFRGRVYVHAASRGDNQRGVQAAYKIFKKTHPDEAAEAIPSMWKLLAFGAIIGEVTITGCVTRSDSPWFTGPYYGFVLADPVVYETPIPCKGRLGFFKPDVEVNK